MLEEKFIIAENLPFFMLVVEHLTKQSPQKRFLILETI